MANPQKENGYVAIANELFEALCRTRLPGEARQVFDAILRLTWGWNAKYKNISYRELQTLTGLQYGHIYRSLKQLQEHKFIVRTKKGYGIQKDYSLWITYSKSGYSKSGYSKNGVKPTPKMEYFPTPKAEYATPLKPNTGKGLRTPKPVLNHINHISPQAKLAKLWENTLPNIPFPVEREISFEKIDYFLHKVIKGEIIIDQIRNIKAYIRGLTIEPFPNIFERERLREARLKAKAEERAREDEEVAKIDHEANKKKARELIERLSGKHAILQN